MRSPTHGAQKLLTDDPAFTVGRQLAFSVRISQRLGGHCGIGPSCTHRNQAGMFEADWKYYIPLIRDVYLPPHCFRLVLKFDEHQVVRRRNTKINHQLRPGLHPAVINIPDLCWRLWAKSVPNEGTTGHSCHGPHAIGECDYVKHAKEHFIPCWVHECL